MPVTRSGASTSAGPDEMDRQGRAMSSARAAEIDRQSEASSARAEEADVSALKLQLLREKAALCKKQNELEREADDADRETVCQLKDAIVDQELIVATLSHTIEELSFRAASSTRVDQPHAAVDVTLQRLLARQIIDGKLPRYDGDPLKWKSFKACYTRTTEQLSLSDEENVGRLQEALQGTARRHVAHLLHEPGRLRDILELLERRFGDKTIRLRCALQKLETVQKPDTEKPQSVIDFAEAVNDLAALTDDAEGHGHAALMVEKKLSPSLLSQWQMYCVMLRQPGNFADLRQWAAQLADNAWKAIAISGEPLQKTTHDVGKSSTRRHVHSVDTRPQLRACYICKEPGHFANACEKLKKMTVSQRMEAVRKSRLCENCLLAGHAVGVCRNTSKCTIVNCGARHHPLLHAGLANVATNALHASAICGYSPVLPVNVTGPYGTVAAYAFIDSGSNTSFVDPDVAAIIGAFGPAHDILIDGYFSKEQRVAAQIITITVAAAHGGKPYDLKNVLCAKIPLGVSVQNADDIKARYAYAKDVPLVSFSAVPTLLIGSGHTYVVESQEVVARHPGEPRFYRSKLGWYVMGPKLEVGASPVTCYTHAVRSGDDLHEAVRRNILMDDIGVHQRPRLLAIEEERAMELLQRTVNRTGPTTIEIGLLWRTDDVHLPDNYNSALLRLQCLERKMMRDATYDAAIKKKYIEYLEKGYMSKTNLTYGQNRTPRDWYIPIFGISNKNKPGKIRLVADCAAETKGTSLNQALLKGPDLNNSIVGTLIRFRRYKYAAVADVEEMFHRVFIRPADRCAQRILWRDGDRTRDPDIYEFNVMTFGATCSPVSAQFVKNWNAEQHKTDYPVASAAIQSQFYVDDYLDSFRTIEDASAVIKDVILVQSRARMKMTRWISSHPSVLQDVPEELLSPKADKLLSGGESSFVLGVKWHRDDDTLLLAARAADADADHDDEDEIPTKRQALAKVMAVYDPLGLASFVSARGKILLQDTWRAGVEWDQLLPDDLRDKWRIFINARQLIQSLPIPRVYSCLDFDAARRELHVFCDASESAYAAVVYIRTVLDGTVDCQLAFGKSRVAPQKPCTIPRLELQAALLGARIADLVKEELRATIHRCIYWSDSTTAIAWIKSQTRRYTVYVSNRVGEILDRSNASDWRWVPTTENPADYATRCVPFVQDTGVWLNGPAFIRQPEEHWPTRDECPPTHEEERVCVLAVHAEASFPVVDVTRFSRLEKLLRVTACVLRQIGTTGPFAVAELDQALLHHVRVSQAESFPEEINRVQRALAAKGRLKRVEGFLADGYLRVRTRLLHADHLAHDMRFPYVLDGTHTFTKLLIDQLHRRRGHQGVETVKNDLRQRFYILGASAAVKAAFRRCPFCKVRRSLPTQPRMGDLPTVRLRSNVQPFEYTGLDYFGPFYVKLGRRREKRWGAVFTCLAVRAVHLEIVTSLSADSALQAMQRMSSRRGAPRVIYCDNGTCFHGADAELQLMRQQTAGIAESRGMQFSFIPPYAPHMAGVWERLVRSVKTTLGGLLLEHTVTDETAYTTFTEVEWILNCRPLTPVSADPDDSLPLTPNHFLLGWRSGATGQPLHPREEFAFDDADLYRRRQWKVAQRLADLFWHRWTKEYLPTIANRSKWTRESTPLKEGDVVLILDPNAPRNEWRKGLIVKTFPGKDGTVRVADVRTEKSVLRRALTQLCLIADGRDKTTDGAQSEEAVLS